MCVIYHKSKSISDHSTYNIRRVDFLACCFTSGPWQYSKPMNMSFYTFTDGNPKDYNRNFLNKCESTPEINKFFSAQCKAQFFTQSSVQSQIIFSFQRQSELPEPKSLKASYSALFSQGIVSKLLLGGPS